ncbi:hypothetical protein [Mucilaginibacter auburnensis]|uniref:Lipoprotein n=1 Tax=Mucilaginibacter auburnensis TaxID=1457233 RepID=A0A2H9VSD9_9SPHI|nr:hypothetical protein [Mucilaginibacter auburnensis]PJJ83728.1 hypothetical protein CLV57_0721 [Mucilaginibacter auburnensis]
MRIRNFIIPVALAVAASACTSSEKKDKDGDTVINGDTLATPVAGEAASMCFVRTEGAKDQDTTSVELVVKDDKVTGQMYWHPFEKDSRKGDLSGTLKGDTVNAVWTFMQEGMKDTLALQFLMKGNTLLQKPLKLNTKTGREQTDNNAGYTVSYKPTVDLKKK